MAQADRKFKIMHMITGLQPGGTEHMLLKILPRMKDFDHHVCSVRGPGWIGDELQKAEIRVTYLTMNRNGMLPKMVHLGKLLREERPDILSTYLPRADLLGRVVGRLWRVPKIVCHLQCILRDYVLPDILDRSTQRLVDRYSAVSEAVRDHYVNKLHFDPNKIEVIPNTVQDSWFSDHAKRCDDKNLPKLVCLARLREQKGHVYLFDALSNLVSTYPNVKLLCLGDGPERSRLQAHVQGLGIEKSVAFLGDVSDPREYLSSNIVFVLPTLYEGMCHAILEAMACQCPIVTTSIPENLEILSEGESALLVPPKNSEALAASLSRVLGDADLRQKLAQDARESAEQYRLSRVVRRWNDFYFSLVSGSSQGSVHDTISRSE